ncbi:MAG: hypothetical protein PUP46_00520, partial [Endozoicomonas sp. (ex Botrylloides leachii)]|nr:hypothetical protein [Endozoicomonas sp. (ex Botrylloides leachii)]
MPQIPPNSVNHLISQLEAIQTAPSRLKARFNTLNVSKTTPLSLQVNLDGFRYKDKTGHSAFVAALADNPDKSILDRGIKIIQDDCYTGCTKEKKSSVLKRLSTHAKSLNPNSSVNSSPIDDA